MRFTFLVWQAGKDFLAQSKQLYSKLFGSGLENFGMRCFDKDAFGAREPACNEPHPLPTNSCKELKFACMRTICISYLWLCNPVYPLHGRLYVAHLNLANYSIHYCRVIMHSAETCPLPAFRIPPRPLGDCQAQPTRIFMLRSIAILPSALYPASS